MRRGRLLPLLALALATGCVGGTDDFDGDGTPDALDCDPADPLLNLVDADQDGSTTCAGDCDDADPTRESLDRDLDGVSSCDGDCDDVDADIRPGVDEVCDGEDTDCDGALPEEEADDDGDGVPACADCGPQDPTVYPGAPELCDALDNDCNGSVPEEEVDGDGDGHLLCGDDCDDTDPTQAPGLPDICNNRDDDCDGKQDEDSDTDGDGFCLGDCDDSDPSIFPGSWADAAPGGADDGVDRSCDGADGFTTASAAVTVELPVGFGMIVHAEADLTGDGVVDVIVGNDGVAYLISGATLAAAMTESWQAQLTAADTLLTMSPANEFAFLGDLEGDGFEDVAVTGSRSVQILSGAAVQGASGTSLELETAASWVIEGASYDDRFGSALSASPVGSGGVADLLVGASGYNANEGRAYVFEAGILSTGSVTTGDASRVIDWAAGDGLGKRVAWGSDLDGDGGRDLLLGTDVWPEGLVYVVPSGAPAAVELPGGALTSLGPGTTLGFGEYGFLDLGDLDGDGLAELLVTERANWLWIFTGAQVAAGGALSSADATAWFRFPANAGGPHRRQPLMKDLDGDGGADLVVGISGNSSCESGIAIVPRPELEAALALGGETWLGTVGWLLLDAPDECESLGRDVAVADLDGDGRPELIAGAPNNEYTVGDSGRLYVFRSPF